MLDQHEPRSRGRRCQGGVAGIDAALGRAGEENLGGEMPVGAIGAIGVAQARLRTLVQPLADRDGDWKPFPILCAYPRAVRTTHQEKSSVAKLAPDGAPALAISSKVFGRRTGCLRPVLRRLHCRTEMTRPEKQFRRR